jgi:PAS domain S-box-containing protein
MTISNRKQTAVRARSRVKELQLTIDSIPVVAWHACPGGVIEYLNRRWLGYTGLSLERALGRGWEVAIHPEDLPGLLTQWDASLKAGKPGEAEARLRRFDGEFRWFLMRWQPSRDEHGEIVRWYGTNTDIEDRKSAEVGLRRSETHLTEAQKLSLTGSFIWKVGNEEIFCSEQTCRIFGYDPATRPTINLVRQRVHPDDIGVVQKTFEQALLDTQAIDLEHRLEMPDGSIKYVHVLARVAMDASKHTELVGSVMDVTAAKRSEEALRKTQAELAHVTRVTTLGELTASIAHEVSQPLAAILINGEATLRSLDRKEPDIAKARHTLKRTINDANRASEVIRRIRQLAKKAAPEMAPLDLNDVIADTMPLVQRQAMSHSVKLRLQLELGLPAVLGDRVQLQQVIMNLVINGIDAMLPVIDRPREIIVRSQRYDRDEVLVAVQDYGVGIEPENANRLFNAFYTTKPQGMGMGLSICRSIVEAHGGRIRAFSCRGPGATVQFTLQSIGQGACT